jgi:Phage ABA sandwich domain
MTDQQIIETLATKVMGWEEEKDFNRYKGEIWVKVAECSFNLWNPLQNIADAWMLMDKLKQRYFCEVAMTEIDDGYWHWMARVIEVLGSPYQVKTYKSIEREAPRAISMAAYKLVA